MSTPRQNSRSQGVASAQAVAGVLILALLGVALLRLPVSGTLPASGPRLAMAGPTEKHLGGIAPQLVKAAFPIENQGDRRLVLNRIRQDCHCLGQHQPTIIIAPGEVEFLWFDFDVRFAEDEFTEQVEYSTNDPTRPRLCLVVKGHVEPGSQPRPIPAVEQSVLVHTTSGH